MSTQNLDSPVRPPRPAFLVLDTDSETFEDQHIDYYPVERLENAIDEDVVVYNHHDAMTSYASAYHEHEQNYEHTARDSFDNSAIPISIPASVRSFSRDSLGHVFSFAFPYTRRHGDSVDTDDAFAPTPPCTSPDPSSRADSPPISPGYAGLWSTSRSGSRSPLAGPPLYSPTETVVGTPDPNGKKVMSPFGFKDIRLRKGGFKSNALLDLDTVPIDKPWENKKEALGYVSYWLTWSMVLLMAGASALLTLVDLNKIHYVGNLCLVLDDNFDNGIDRSIWFHEVDMSGFGNHEFEMTTASENNSYTRDGVLYIVPTLTSDEIGKAAIFNGYTYNITGCTNGNLTACSAVSNSSSGSVINPVQSAKLTTRFSRSIQYGRVEVRARMPKGDWLWPAIWMLPVNNEYGVWPMSGEIDIMESRGNGPEYGFRGRDFIQSSLNWGPADFIDSVSSTFGWYTQRRKEFSDEFHTFVLEWSPVFLRMYVDSRLHTSFNIDFNKPFFERGHYPETALNGSEQVAITNPWKGRGNSAPFDQPFYLILNVAAGGRNGWFPDTIGGKMWFDSSADAMHDFAYAQEKWYSTWPKNPEERAMAIDYVRMWQKC